MNEDEAARERERRLRLHAEDLTADAFAGDWPFIVSAVSLRVEFDEKLGPKLRGGPVSVAVGDEIFALNGIGRARGYPWVGPILKPGYSAEALAQMIELAHSRIPPAE